MLLKNKWLWFLFAAGLLLRLAVALTPPQVFYYSVDEKIMSDATLFLFLNSTPVCLEWPATSLMFPLYVISGLRLLGNSEFIHSMLHSDMIGISTVITNHIYLAMQSGTLVLAGRIFIALCILSSVFILFRLLSGQVNFFRIFFMVMYSFSAAFVIQSWVLHPDSLAVVCWTIFIVYFLFHFQSRTSKPVILLGMLLAITCAAKMTYALAFPLVLISCLSDYKLSGWKKTVRACFTFSLSFIFFLLAFVPFLWTHTLTWAKGFFGNIMMKSSGEGNSALTFFTIYLPNLITWPGMLLMLAGLLLSFKNKNVRPVFLLFIFILFSFPVINASESFERYTLPLLPVILAWSAFGFEWITGLFKVSYLKIIIPSLILVSCVALSMIQIGSEFKKYHQPTNFTDCINWLQDNLNNEEAVAVPARFENYFRESMSCLERIDARNQDSVLVDERIAKQLGNKFKGNLHALRQQALCDIFLEEREYISRKTRLKMNYLVNNGTTGNVLNAWYYSNLPFANIYTYKEDEILNNPVIRFVVTEEKMLPQFNLLQSFDTAGGRIYRIYEKQPGI